MLVGVGSMADLEWNGDQAARKITTGKTSAARQGAHLLRDEAVQRTPLETGTLRNSAKVTAGDGEAAVSYNTPYAVKQHEEIGYAHKDGQAKFLETAMVDNRDKIAEAIATHLRRIIG